MKKNILIIFLILFFCTHGFLNGLAQDKFRILKKDGVPVAVNPHHPVPSKNSPRDIAFTEELILGKSEGNSHYVFGEYIRFTVDKKGNIYVLDWMEKTVRKFDKKGNYQLTFGREGQGPGEFTFPKEIKSLPDGHIIVFEGEAQKFSCFTLEGDFVKSGRFKKLLSAPYFGLTGDSIIAKNVVRESNKTTVVTGVFDANSELLFALHEQKSKPQKPWPSQKDVDARARRLAEICSKIAFRPKTVVALNEKENIYFAYSDHYEIKIYSSNGALKRAIRTDLPFLPVEKEGRDRFVDYWLARDISTWNTMSKQMQNKIKSLIRFPEKKPAFLSIIPMDKDFVMVVRDGYYGLDSTIDVFDSSGRFIIEKKLDFNINEGLCRGDKLYTLHEDEVGNQFVKRYRYKFIK